MLCGQRTLLCEAGGQGVAASLQCRRWSCHDCEMRNRSKVRSYIVELGPAFHIIFSSNPHWLDGPDARAKCLSAAVATCRRRLRRQFGQKFNFVAVFAKTMRGEPHIHVVMDGNQIEANTLERLLSKWMGDLVGAPNVVVKPVHDPVKLARYICRDGHIQLFAGCRRFWTSRGWRVARWAENAKCSFKSIVRGSLATVERMALDAGHIIIDRSRLRFITLVPFTPP